MTDYRRNFIRGATYFFTVNLANRQSNLLTDNIELLREAFRATRLRHPFDIQAMVVLPEHLHAIWTLPDNNADYSTRWRLIKSHFSRNLPDFENINASRLNKSERGIWQRRYWEHTIRDDMDFERHVDYIHINPVKHGLVAQAADWPHSSFHQYVKDGILPSDWAGVSSDGDGKFGERL
jgi:putative transposase